MLVLCLFYGPNLPSEWLMFSFTSAAQMVAFFNDKGYTLEKYAPACGEATW